MPVDKRRLKRAVERNLADLNNSILKRRAYNALMSLGSAHGLNFFRVAAHSLHNDLYSDAHRVFDKHKDAASFWYVIRVAPKAFSNAVKKTGVSLKRLEQIAAKLVHLRDRTHFHIDKRFVEDPPRVWSMAAITGNEIIYLTDQAHEVLRLMYLEITGNDSPVADYNGNDIGLIVRAYKNAHPNAPLAI